MQRKTLMRRTRGLVGYFALAFAIAWGGVALAAPHGRLAMFAAMLLGPSLAGIGVTAALDGTRGLRELMQRLLRVRVGARWFLAPLVAPGLLLVILFTLSSFSPSFLPAIFTTTSPGTIVGLAAVGGLGAGLFEELGWTGFATPELLRRHSWFRASLLLGPLWALWHVLPDYLSRATYGALWSIHMLQWLVALVAYRVFMTWVYTRTRSLLVGVLMHMTFTGGQALLWPSVTPREELIWYGLFACGLWIVVGTIVLASRRFPSVAASRAERDVTLPGDGLIPHPIFAVTHAITIEAPPERVWPWLSQMGADRGGWYSYDSIDNGGRPSADRVREELQRLAPGDVLPALPGATDVFVVTAVERRRDLVLAVPGDDGPIMSWEHLVEPIASDRSRLIVRSRVARSWNELARNAHTAGKRPVFIEYVYRVLGRLPDVFLFAIGRAGHRVMEARHLRGIKRRAELAAA